MLGHIRLTGERGRRPVLEHRRVMGMTVLEASIPLPPGTKERAICRRVDKAARLLFREGVRRVLVPEGFDRWEILHARGLGRVEAAPLCQTLAAPLALAALERMGIAAGHATVVLRGNRVSRPFFQAAETLAAEVRGVAVSSPNGGEALSAHLRGEYGVPILEEGPGARADLILDFSLMPAGGTAALLLHGRPELGGVMVQWKEGTWPDGFEVLPLATALWEAGLLYPDDLICE